MRALNFKFLAKKNKLTSWPITELSFTELLFNLFELSNTEMTVNHIYHNQEVIIKLTG